MSRNSDWLIIVISYRSKYSFIVVLCCNFFFPGRSVTAIDVSYFYACSLFVCLTKVATTKAAYILVMYYFKLHKKITWTEVTYSSCHVLLFWLSLQNSFIFVWDLSLIFQYHSMNLFLVFLCLKWTQITSCCILSFSVITRCLNYICRHFRTLCLFHLHRRCKQVLPAYTAYDDGTERVFRNVGI
jgi:hypothetical protein